MEKKRSKRGRFQSQKRHDQYAKKEQKDSIAVNNVMLDHQYPIEVGAEEEIAQNELINCLDGRRVVELDVIAKGLQACAFCTNPMYLHDAVNIRCIGLAAVMHVKCHTCGYQNYVATGKKHGRIFDMNTKLATGMLHAGVGESQINAILSSLNIPPVNHSLLDKRQRETGLAIESVANESVEKYLIEEARLDEEHNNSIEVSVDAGWQKRGSGKAYNSLSGHSTMIGVKTGKVVGYSVRSKKCRKCENQSKKHDCRRNWTGSAKSMEPDMVAEMIETNLENGVKTRGIIGDDDATTISRIRQSVDSNITKRSDKNHVTKTLSNKLYKLQTCHPELSIKVIKYILKLFNYNLAENKNNPSAICSGLDAISNHPFGKHQFCKQSWCKFLSKPDSRYTSLPHGRPLQDNSLQEALVALFMEYKQHAIKLSSLGSTQANENLNKVIASKAPKSQHYSGSASLNFRIAASVAQKNVGHSYVTSVRLILLPMLCVYSHTP